MNNRSPFNLVFVLVLSALLIPAVSFAKNSLPEEGKTKASVHKTTSTAEDKKKLNLDFEDEIVKGSSDAPDVMFLNTRRAIKYKELFDMRTNFIQEVEQSRELFNDF